MALIDDAIYVLNPTVKYIIGDVAYNQDEQVVEYNLASAQAKLIELQTAETQAEQAAKDAKVSALAKLSALGLTQAEITALIG
jgi:phage I-like protein